jgi:SAM-dependent methyltransferase
MERINACRVCGNPEIVEFLDLGEQPYANSLLKSPDEKEGYYPLSLSWCPECNLVQLNHTAEPEELFSEYVWVTSTSSTALEHAWNFFRDIISRVPDIKESYVLEAASNDGAFLKPFVQNGYKVLGIDPARNIAELAEADGIPTICDFFGVEAAGKIVKEYGEAEVVIARNVLPHVANLHDFVQGLGLCLAENGLMIVEFHYAGVIFEELHYDSIYHEHLCYYTLKSIEHLFNRYGLYIIDIRKSLISGGSLVLYIEKRKGNESEVVQSYRDAEKDTGINALAGWQDFAEKVRSHRRKLLNILTGVTEKKGPIVGYGASARSSTMLNYCGIDTGFLSVIADQNPLKQGRYTAGTHIPIVSPEEVIERNPEYILILAWNFTDEIRGILRDRFDYKGSCILPLPGDPKIIDAGE